MNVRDLRHKYLEFFRSKGHTIYPSGSLIPFDVTGRLDESLLFNGAGMVQFKPFFRGVATPPNARLTTAQRCLRTGDIEVVGDDSHLTFFEMLGNFSFGDYFKKEAIALSWEFLTSAQWLGLDPKRLAFTVFEKDDEAEGHWAEWLTAAGLTPEHRVFRLGEETNVWPAGAFTNGPPGPCGPNSEMFYWTPADEEPPSGPYHREDFLRDEGQGKWLEIWNDVFIQFEWQGEPEGTGYRKTGMPDLPMQSIDTGMGLERTAAVLGGKTSVYDTDAFQPIFAELTAAGAPVYGVKAEVDRAMRIVADHGRAACFCIADGVLPSNTGRGYVLRRLIRRAVLKGQRVLGFTDAFLHHVVAGVVATMGDHYAELVDRRAVIESTLRGEEAQFRRTLAQGSELLAAELDAVTGGVLPGAIAFRLYDTYGFPPEITRELAAERGVAFDDPGYQAALEEAQRRSRGASEMDTVYGGVEADGWTAGDAGPTEFTGYTETEGSARILAVRALDGARAILAFDKSPFYAESGGQVADHGWVTVGLRTLDVVDVQKEQGVWRHVVTGVAPEELTGFVGQNAHLKVDLERRGDVVKHHTATHLLHAALRETLGTHVTQAGSLVSPTVLRFDFTHGAAVTDSELQQVEDRVNEWVMRAEPMRIYDSVPIQEARAMGAMALFGEKYGDAVRVVQVGGMDPSESSWSRELCGGIHVRNTGEIGLFRITHESSVAGGVRRVSAVCGRVALAEIRAQAERLEEAARKLKTNPREVSEAIDRLNESLREERKKREKLLSQGAGSGGGTEERIGPVVLKSDQVEDAEQDDMKRVADRLVGNDQTTVAMIVNRSEGKVTFLVKVGDAAIASGAHAGQIVQAMAVATGGGGGGKADFARAGGRDATKVDAALEAGRAKLAELMGQS